MCATTLYQQTDAQLYILHIHTHPDSDDSGKGLMFRIGSMVSDPDDETSYNNPDCFAWCLMNLTVSKLIQNAVRKILSTAGLEVLGS